MDTTGAVLGPLLALLYLHFHPGDYRSLFIIAFLPALAGVMFTLIIKSKAASNAHQTVISAIQNFNVLNANLVLNLQIQAQSALSAKKKKF